MELRMPALPVETDRTMLRGFRQGDFADYAAYHALPEVYRYLYAAPLAGAALERWFAEILSAPFATDGDIYRLAVARRDDGALLGEVTLKLARREAAQGEVGYIFNPAFAGQGYASEAVAAMIGVGFSCFGFHRIFARLDTANARSVRVVERLGLRREAHLIENDRFDGVWGSEYIYAVLAADWRPATTVTFRN